MKNLILDLFVIYKIGKLVTEFNVLYLWWFYDTLVLYLY